MQLLHRIDPRLRQRLRSQSRKPMVMASDIIERLKAIPAYSHQLCLALFLYHLPMPDPSPSNADSLNSNFLQLGRRSDGRPQRTVYPRRLPVNTVIHTTLAGIEPTTFRLLVRRAIPVVLLTHQISQNIVAESFFVDSANLRSCRYRCTYTSYRLVPTAARQDDM